MGVLEVSWDYLEPFWKDLGEDLASQGVSWKAFGSFLIGFFAILSNM